MLLKELRIKISTDPVEIWGKVIGPVANDPFPDELSLAFKPKHVASETLILELDT